MNSVKIPSPRPGRFSSVLAPSRIALVLASMAIAAVVRDPAAATLCSLIPSEKQHRPILSTAASPAGVQLPSSVEVSNLDVLHEVDGISWKDRTGPLGEPVIDFVHRHAENRGYGLTVRRIEIPDRDIDITIAAYLPAPCASQ